MKKRMIVGLLLACFSALLFAGCSASSMPPIGDGKAPRDGATVYQQPDAKPEVSADGVKGAVTQAYYTTDGHLAVRMNLSNGMGAAQQLRSIEIRVINGEGAEIASGYAEAVGDGDVLKPDELTPFLLYIAPEQIRITDDPLTTLAFEITVTTEPVE